MTAMSRRRAYLSPQAGSAVYGRSATGLLDVVPPGELFE